MIDTSYKSHGMSKSRDEKNFGTGLSDGLDPLKPLDVAAVESFDELLAGMAQTAFGGRQLGEAAELLFEMASDPDCWVVGTFSGAMTVAKQGLLIVEMIERGLLNAIVTTGALMTHGLVEGAGMKHFKHRAHMDDADLFEKGYDRVYDTLELESNLGDLERIVSSVLDGWDSRVRLSSRTLLDAIGEHLERENVGRSILGAARACDVPVYVPAFTDSELGLDFALHNEWRAQREMPLLEFDPFLDLTHFRELVTAQKTIGIFTIGGGVPRNWAQQVACYEDLRRVRFPELASGKTARYRYGVRICPEPVHWGGLSGCTYSEGVSWGKFAAPTEGGRFAEVYADATIAWPVLLKAVLERLKKT